MKPVIVFDLGKVLVDFDYHIAARKVASRSTKQLDNLHHFLGSSEILARFESGLLTRRQFFTEMSAFTGFTGTIEEFVSDFADIFIAIPPMIELHAGLRQRGFRTFIFSNTNNIAVEHIRRNFPFFANFDGYIYSYEVGAMKPHQKIYEAVENLCGNKGKEIIYIDNRPENIDAGAARHWNAILHETPDKTRSLLTQILNRLWDKVD